MWALPPVELQFQTSFVANSIIKCLCYFLLIIDTIKFLLCLSTINYMIIPTNLFCPTPPPTVKWTGWNSFGHNVSSRDCPNANSYAPEA